MRFSLQRQEAQDRYCARRLDLCQEVRRRCEDSETLFLNSVETEKNRDTESSNCDVYLTCVDVRCFL